MDPVCIRLGAICRADIHSGKMRHPEDGFRHGHGHPDDRGPAVFVADGGHRRLRADHHRPEREDVGLATGASWLCYFRALQLGDVNKVVPIDKSSTILTIVLAFLFLGEGITWLKGAAVVLIAIGTFLMIEKKAVTENKAERKSWLLYAILSAVFASLTSILGKVGIEGVESNLGTAIRTGVVLVMAWLIVFVKGKQHTLKEVPKKELGFICLSGLATGGSWLCYYKALQDGLASVVVPIDKLSILVSIAFSAVVFHERLSKKAALGLVLIVAGTLMMIF